MFFFLFPFFSSSCCGLVCCYLCFHEGVGCLGYLRHLRLVTISSWTEVPLGKSFREWKLTELRQRPSCSQSRTSIDALRWPPHPWNLKSESPSYDQHIVVQRFTGYSIEGEKKNPCFSFLHSGRKRAEGAANEQMGVTRGAARGVRPFKANSQTRPLAYYDFPFVIVLSRFLGPAGFLIIFYIRIHGRYFQENYRP